MAFRLSNDEMALRDTIGRYCEDQYRDNIPRRSFNGEALAHSSFTTGMFELGVGGILVDPEYGGLGLRVTDAAFVSEILGHFSMPGPFIGHVLSGMAISQGGSSKQKEKWLSSLSRGDMIASVAFHESNRILPQEWLCELNEDGLLSGEKTFVLGAEQAHLFVVGIRNGGLALVEASSPGVEIVDLEVLDRTRPAAKVRFSNSPAERLEASAAPVFDALLLLLAADCFGGAQRVLDMTVGYVQQRRQFDRTISNFQAVRHELADLACELECCRGLYWYGVAAFDADSSGHRTAAARAKARLSETFMSICRACVQLHGGIGMTWEYELQLWLKRAMLNFAYAGVPSLHRGRSDV